MTVIHIVTLRLAIFCTHNFYNITLQPTVYFDKYAKNADRNVRICYTQNDTITFILINCLCVCKYLHMTHSPVICRDANLHSIKKVDEQSNGFESMIYN